MASTTAATANPTWSVRRLAATAGRSERWEGLGSRGRGARWGFVLSFKIDDRGKYDGLPPELSRRPDQA